MVMVPGLTMNRPTSSIAGQGWSGLQDRSALDDVLVRDEVMLIPDLNFPKISGNVHRTFFQRNTAPPDFADTTILEVKYQDTTRDCDLWIYTAMFRRIRRYTTKQRSDMIDGTDLIYDDNNGWYTHINLNKLQADRPKRYAGLPPSKGTL